MSQVHHNCNGMNQVETESHLRHRREEVVAEPARHDAAAPEAPDDAEPRKAHSPSDGADKVARRDEPVPTAQTSVRL